MYTKELYAHPCSPVGPVRLRRLAAGVLRSTGLALAVLARRLGRVERTPARLPPVLEFYAEAGAPEGALFVDGQLVGRLPGVTRL